MVWSQKDPSGINVYYSPDGQRTLRITSAGINITPNIFRGETSTWLTWVDKSNRQKNQIKYARLATESGKLLEKGRVPTVNGRVYAPAISLDSEERRVWLVWVEYNGQRENLFASFRNLSKSLTTNWQPPMQITPDTEYSASIPIIDNVSYDRIQVSWMRSSLTDSGAASTDILARDWNVANQQLLRASNANNQNTPRALSIKNNVDTEIFAKRLKHGQALSVDEQAWKNLVHNKNVLTGAVHSGSGASKRLADELVK